MVREIIHDPIFLAQKSQHASQEDLDTARDLLDTLEANRDRCVGMAANMIGVKRRIIVFMDGEKPGIMLNPRIIKQSGPYTAEEGCLSLSGVRKTKRYNKIKLEYQTMDFELRLKSYSGYTAQIIQHELDHCDGILI